jgi:hypothetical protein
MIIAAKDICGNIGNYIATIFYFVASSITVLQWNLMVSQAHETRGNID